jgi:hypothetical protein
MGARNASTLRARTCGINFGAPGSGVLGTVSLPV